MNKVLIVDDHPLVQWALGQAVRGLCPAAEITVLGCGQALREYLRRSGSGFDLVLLDLELPDEAGLALLELLCRREPRPAVLVMSDTERPGDAVQAVDAGAMGFVPKRLTIAEFQDAMQLALDGLVFFPPPPAVPQTPPSSRGGDTTYQTLTDLGGLGFTPRQADVVSLIIEGRQNKQIAQITGVSLDTVKDHVKAILRVLGVKSRSDVVWAVAELQKRQREGGSPGGASGAADNAGGGAAA